MAAPYKHTANELEFMFEEYKEWIKTQGYPVKTVLKSGDVIEHTVNKPLSVESYCLFAKIELKTFYNYLVDSEEDRSYMKPEDLEKRIQLLQMSTRIRDEIRDFQIGGAVVNVFNAGLVSKINGIKEQSEITTIGAKETINIVIDGLKVDLS